MNNAESADESKILTSALIIHWALVAAVFIYAGLAFYLSGTLEMDTEPSMRQIMLLTLIVVSLGSVAAGFFFRRTKLDPKRLAEANNPSDSAQQYVQGIIIQGGLFEAVAIYGLVLCFFFNQFTVFLPFGIVSLLLLLFLRPSRRDYERRLKKGGASSLEPSPEE